MPTADADNQADGEFLIVNSRIRIPLSEFTFTYMRSSGPGGQNVNKVSTKVRLRWAVLESPSLSKTVKERFSSKYARRLTTAGEILITSQRTRVQSRNVDDCLEKLREMLAAAAAVVPKRRKKTKPSKASRERRLQHKKEQASKKQRRQRPGMDD